MKKTRAWAACPWWKCDCSRDLCQPEQGPKTLNIAQGSGDKQMHQFGQITVCSVIYQNSMV
jgi:hypothetical protein